jgi:salicylate hydroxylase
MTAAVETGGCLPRAPWTDLGRVDNAAILAALQAHERLRCEKVAQVRFGARKHGLRVDSAETDLVVRDAELAAHTEFRKQLYSHDVVPRAAAAIVLV